MTLMRLIDAYSRGYITEAEYLAYLDAGYTNDSEINVTTIVYKEHGLPATMRLIKRDPNLRMELEFEVEGTGAGGVIVQGNKTYSTTSVEGRIVGYSVFLDQSATTVFDVYVKSSFPPTSGESIVASAHPTVTTESYARGGLTEVATWNVHLNAGDYIAIEVDSNDTATRAVFVLIIEPATQLLALI